MERRDGGSGRFSWIVKIAEDWAETNTPAHPLGKVRRHGKLPGTKTFNTLADVFPTAAAGTRYYAYLADTPSLFCLGRKNPAVSYYISTTDFHSTYHYARNSCV